MTTLNASTFPQTGYAPTVHVELPTRVQLIALRDEFLRVGRKESAAALDNALDVILGEAEEIEQIELCNRIVEANEPAFEAMRVGLNKIADMSDSADGALARELETYNGLTREAFLQKRAAEWKDWTSRFPNATAGRGGGRSVLKFKNEPQANQQANQDEEYTDPFEADIYWQE